MRIKIYVHLTRNSGSNPQLDSVLKTIGDSESDVIVFPEETLRTETLDEIDKIRNAVGHKHVFLGVIYLYRNRTYNFGYYISANKVERYQKTLKHKKNLLSSTRLEL